MQRSRQPGGRVQAVRHMQAPATTRDSQSGACKLNPQEKAQARPVSAWDPKSRGPAMAGYPKGPCNGQLKDTPACPQDTTQKAVRRTPQPTRAHRERLNIPCASARMLPRLCGRRASAPRGQQGLVGGWRAPAVPHLSSMPASHPRKVAACALPALGQTNPNALPTTTSAQR